MKAALLSLILSGTAILSALGQPAVYSNPNVLQILDNSPADPYPSTILITNAPWRVATLTVTLSNLSHTAQSDVNVLLVGPQGQAAYLIAGPNGTVDFTHVTLTIDDAADFHIPAACSSGRYKPTGYAPEDDEQYPAFSSPAPAGPYSADLSCFRRTDPNGTWSLYVLDDEQEDYGIIEGGWSLSFEKVYPLALHAMPDGQLEVSWPAEAAGYVLLAAPNLLDNDWSEVLDVPQIINGLKTVSLQPSASPRFFKLSKAL
jgi:subtilisin-like proprotein convertase family protein